MTKGSKPTHLDLDADRALFGGEIDGLVATFCENEHPLGGLAGLLDWRFRGLISHEISRGAVSGKAGECAYFPVRREGRVFHLILVGRGGAGHAGSGERDAPDSAVWEALSKNLSQLKIQKIGISRSDFGGVSDETLAQRMKGMPPVDHAMKEALLALAGKLLSPTRSLEGGSEKFFRQSIQELAADRSLEGLIRDSIPAPQAPKTAVPTPPVPQAHAPAPQLTSSRQEYSGALAQQGIVEALLQFAAQARPATPQAQLRGGHAPKSAAAPGASQSLVSGAPAPSAQPEPSFSFADIPIIEAEPKRAASFRRSVSHAQSILRPRS